MPGGWKTAISIIPVIFALAASACGGDSGDVALSWRTEDGRPLQVSLDNANAHETVIYVDNDSGETIRDAVLRFSPTTVEGAPIGFTVGTATNVPTDFDGDAHVWRLGDIRPNTRVVLDLASGSRRLPRSAMHRQSTLS